MTRSSATAARLDSASGLVTTRERWPGDTLARVDQADRGNGPCGHCDLGTLAFCDGFARRTVTSLMRVQCTLRFEAHDTLFREGDTGVAVFNVVSGAVKVYKLMPDGRRQITGFFFRGDMFGFCLDGDYAYTAEAVTPLSVCRLPMQRLHELSETAPEVQHRILLRMTAKLAQFHDHVLLLGRKTARERVATFLLALSERARRRGDPASPIPLAMGRVDIADYVGLTVETVSRTMTAFKREGLIDLPSPNHVAIPDTQALRAASDGSA
ncbi:helix-turn-helix domain-containing protein [Roseospira marina]|uniref:Helix-turn-helix domain-containing protein n=1 Tax=Roseospira marina TaxID=140057 RepID=A0A5M6IG48_9PROT|nr:cyclic nucleotide-binding domain-containing protein [Roseospira marina]KAA5607286.1 helix-turn-helix domain-containing protein [Roseospira marina]MBB4312559.1 CRP/FNR family transcriptional regulator [Roseospira marina]MBB5085425.1 CRP/FNR family transcriptional regulator [Roseospira marina]